MLWGPRRRLLCRSRKIRMLCRMREEEGGAVVRSGRGAEQIRSPKVGRTNVCQTMRALSPPRPLPLAGASQRAESMGPSDRTEGSTRALPNTTRRLPFASCAVRRGPSTGRSAKRQRGGGSAKHALRCPWARDGAGSVYETSVPGWGNLAACICVSGAGRAAGVPLLALAWLQIGSASIGQGPFHFWPFG
ncbi:hypothetical protein GQ53DRAFT_99577 [Thozetella sp. PMI_491]|nr:hypothetical protein GQ53DRAFT_99577 [Thozetella sp. PMI_491]